MNKQETLEELAIQKRNELGLKGTIDGFVAGAIWQAKQTTLTLDDAYSEGFENGKNYQVEKMYSEEDMKKCWKEATEDMRKQFSTSYAGITFEQWFEQFKNK